MPTTPDVYAGVLVSLKPEFAAAVTDGRKTVELRRRFPSVRPGVRLVIYVTKPVGAVIGTAPIEAVQSAPLESLWRRHRTKVAVTRARFDQYFATRPCGYAVVLGAFEPLGPIDPVKVREIIPGFRPPQSWQYVDAHSLAALRRATSAVTDQQRARSHCSRKRRAR